MCVPAHPANTPTPKAHERLTFEQAENFGSWLDAQLEMLEREFSEYITAQSIKTSQKTELTSRGRS